MDTAILRSRILDLAIHGQLLPQNSADGSVLDLLAAISQSRGQKITPVTDDVPFDLPESWCWVKLGDVAVSVGTKDNQIKASQIKSSGKFPVISQGKNYIDGYCDDENKAIFELPIILFGDHTRNVKYIDRPFVIGADGTKLHKCFCVDAKYIYFWMSWASLQLHNRGYERHYSLLKSILIPLPPLAEQHRIVEKVEELLAAVDKIESAQSDIASAASILQSRILDLAIHGSLTKQEPADGSALDLLAAISQSRGQKITPVTDGVPFDLPESWCWVRLGEIINLVSGTAFNKSDVCESGIRILRGGNIQGDKLVLDDSDVFIPSLYADAEKNIQKGDIIFVASTGSPNALGKSAYISENASGVQIGAFLRIARPKFEELAPFVRYIFSTDYYKHNILNQSGGTNILNIKAKNITDLSIPLPPLAEQRRIVAKVESLFAAIDKLK